MNTRLLGGLALGIGAGVLAGMIGIGGGLVIVPALVYFFKMEQHTAQGTSLAVLLAPSVCLREGILAEGGRNSYPGRFCARCSR